MAVNIPTTPNVRKNESRYALLAWVNTTLQSQFEKVEELCTGAAYCNLTEILFPGSVAMNRVKLWTKLEHDFVHNFKILQNAFQNLGVDKVIPVHMIVQGKPSVNLDFLQWFKQFFDVNYRGHIYDAVEARDGYPIGYGNACQLKKDFQGRSILYSHSSMPETVQTDFHLSKDNTKLRVIVSNRGPLKSSSSTNRLKNGNKNKSALIRNILLTIDIPLPDEKTALGKRLLMVKSLNPPGSNSENNLIDIDKNLFQKVQKDIVELRKACDVLSLEWHKTENLSNSEESLPLNKEYFQKLLHDITQMSQSCESMIIELSKNCASSNFSESNFPSLNKEDAGLELRNISDLDENSLSITSQTADESWSKKPSEKKQDSGICFCDTGRELDSESLNEHDTSLESTLEMTEANRNRLADKINCTNKPSGATLGKNQESESEIKRMSAKRPLNECEDNSYFREYYEQLRADNSALLETCEFMINEKSHFYSNLRQLEETCYESELNLCQSFPMIDKLCDVIYKAHNHMEKRRRKYYELIQNYEVRKIRNRIERTQRHAPNRPSLATWHYRPNEDGHNPRQNFESHYDYQLSLAEQEDLIRLERECCELRRINTKISSERDELYTNLCEIEKDNFENDVKINQVFPIVRKIHNDLFVLYKQLKEQRCEYDECLMTLESSHSNPPLDSRLFSEIYENLYVEADTNRNITIEDINKLRNYNLQLRHIHEKMLNEKVKFLSDMRVLNENYIGLEDRLNDILPIMDRLYCTLNDIQNDIQSYRLKNSANMRHVHPMFANNFQLYEDLYNSSPTASHPTSTPPVSPTNSSTPPPPPSSSSLVAEAQHHHRPPQAPTPAAQVPEAVEPFLQVHSTSSSTTYATSNPEINFPDNHIGDG